MVRIFISYSRRDIGFASRLATDLSRLGADIWIDVDDIPAGMNWSTAIQHGLDTCDVMFVILSPASMASINVENEWQYFLDHGHPVIPILWHKTRVHFQLHRKQYIDFEGQDYRYALAQLLAELRRRGFRLTPPAYYSSDVQIPVQKPLPIRRRSFSCLFSGAIVIGVFCLLIVLVTTIFMNAYVPEPPLSDDFKPSREEAQAFSDMLESAEVMAGERTGWFWYSFTERQISSWMKYEGADFAEGKGNAFPFKDVQVGLGDGEVTFYGKVWEIGVPVEVVIEPEIDDKGEMTFEITSVDFGGLGLPAMLFDSVSDQFRDLLVEPFEDVPGTLYFEQESFYLDDGEFRVQGLVQ